MIMEYRKYGKADVKFSVIGLGGHEFGAGDHIKGFQDSKDAVKPGYTQKGFGGENRKAIVHRALDLGINVFDVTIDPEIEALGRLLEGKNDVFIQTRPQGMVYSYDRANRKMADYSLLKKEVTRLTELLRRERVDILNFAFMQEALDSDPDYMNKMGENIARLKQEGLIRFASADNFSGNATYLAQINSGHFDSIFINYNFRDTHMEDYVIPKAMETETAVLTRELFMKAQLFKMAEEAGETDRALVARTTLKWIMGKPGVTTVMMGVANPEQLTGNLSVLESPELDKKEEELISKIQNTDLCRKELSERRAGFYEKT
jgi:aryl-alcohol dehydrogenase-like predicted oxidoreductase